MRVKKVTLTNFRNYAHASVDLLPGRNILIGENAQGKTNFLEAIEIITSGKSERAQTDQDLILKGEDTMILEVQFESRGQDESVAMSLHLGTKGARGQPIQKQYRVNGLTQSTYRSARGRLVTVGFKSQDLYLLRGGPKYRRDWIDMILSTLRPAFRETASKYQKVIVQRNRLLKTLFEKGRLTVTDQDQLKAWDTQVSALGAHIIRQRLDLLGQLVPKAQRFQEHISASREQLEARYTLSRREETEWQDEEISQPAPQALADLEMAGEDGIAQELLRLLRLRRAEEIARKQTLAGPHRDDITFTLNDANAVDFASQGQQRSLVLALKLAELERVSEVLDEPPVLLLDDVLAELDLSRQGLLMSLVGNNMQTIITTTHLDGFQPEWIEGAQIMQVSQGAVKIMASAPLGF